MRIFIDADACPVKDEVYKVAARYGLKTFVVSNSFIQIPLSPQIERRIVDAGPDVADDWIADEAQPGDIVVTNDIPLADRVLKAGAAAIAPNGRSRRTPSARPWPSVRSWSTSAPPARSPAAPGRSRRPIGRAFCRRWTRP